MDILVTSFLVLICLFGIGWWVAGRIGNVSIVDAMWALALPIPVVMYCAVGNGSWARNVILLTLAIVWSLRLGIHLAVRISRHHPVEDKRYSKLREIWGAHSNKNFFFLFQINAALVFLLSLPFYFASQNTASIQVLEWIGLGVFLIGLAGESIADKQLASFLKNKQGKVICEVGLWNYSRHPNYFFEAVIWVGIYLFCAASPTGIYTIHAPILMTILLTRVTGIPPTERSSIESKGDAYRAYQQTTSAFIPWFKSPPKS